MRFMGAAVRLAKKATDAKYTYAVVAIFAAALVTSVPSVYAEDTTINVNLCGTTTIQINRPTSDSVVPRAEVPISGTVQNSNQIEVSIDDEFSGYIPISSSDVVFDSTVTLGKGTHTVTLEALNSCGGASATASVVLSYLPSRSSSTGGDGGLIVGPGGEVDEVNYKQNTVDILRFFTSPFEGLTKWLNIDDGTQTHGLAYMSLWRAIAATVSLYFMLFSVPLPRREWLGSRWPFASLFPHMDNDPRMKVMGLVVRIIGLIVLIGVLTL